MLSLTTVSLVLLSEAVNGLFATRYWDCCKPHCSWTSNTYGVSPMPSCTKANVSISDANTQSACDSATATNAYTCFNNVPVAVDANNAIGFAAVPVTSTNPPSDVCGKCYKLTFTGAGQYGSNPGATALAGKSMIVQASNIGYDVAHDQFDIQIPGGGVGAFDACSSQWGASDLGAQYGGFLTQCQSGNPPFDQIKTCVRNKCNSVFSAAAFAPLLAGCLWFVDWYQCADNPVVTSVEVTCPAALLAISNMNRAPPPPTAPTTAAPTNAPGSCPTGNCGCSWANSNTCATNDGTPCNIACCCPFRQPANLCTNGVQDSGETGVDCGGTCPNACAFCTVTNCGPNGNCDAVNSRCNCINGYTGTYCNTPPNLCPNNKCQPHGTCAASTGVCTCTGDYSGTLCDVAPTCTDGVKNQQEVQIDCGGPNCASTPCTGYQWSPGPWNACTVTCGGGTQTRSVVCLDASGAVASSGCDTLHPAVTSQSCNPDPCPTYSWATGAWSQCSQPCGGGTQTRTVQCQSSVGMSAVDASFCSPANIPPSSQSCNPTACQSPYWATGEWTTCSMLCGGGTQNRTVTCMDPSLNPVAPAANPSSCTAAAPPNKQSCNIIACQNYKWLACAWEACTAQCNGKDGMLGTQTRTVLCTDSAGTAVDPSLCPNATIPSTLSSACNPQKCTTANWMANGPWSACVNGMRTRSFHCHNADGSNADNSVCVDGAGPQPSSSEACTLNSCPPTQGPAVGAASSLAPLFGLSLLSLVYVF